MRGSLVTTIVRIARLAEPRLSLVWGVLIFIALSSLFQMAGLSLVIPVLNGLAESKKFAGLERTAVLGELIRTLPFTRTDGAIFLFLMGLIFLAVLCENLTLYLGQRFSARLSTDAVYHIRRAIFGRYLRFSKSFFDRQQTGELSSLLTQVPTQVGNLVEQLTRLLILLAFSLTFFTLMLVISWQLTILAGVLLPITHYLSRYIARRIQQSARGEVAESVRFSGRVVDVLSNMSLVHLSSAELMEQERVSAIADEARRHGFNVRSKRFAAPRIVDVVDSLGVLLVVCFGVWLYFTTGSESPGRFFVYFLTLRRFTNHLEQLTGVVAALFETGASAERLLWVFDDADKDFTLGGSRTFPGLQDEIRYLDVSFSYGPEKPVLKNVSFTVKRGEVVALVGATGAGKTTLLNLLPRFYDPVSGRIEIDGVDLREFKVSGLRRRISVVSQDALLLSESLRENLLYGLEVLPARERIEEALTAAALDSFIAGLPEGLETQIGTKGVKLSGGEKQRLSLARAILRDPEILILDEATSALDSATELRIQAALESLFRGRTVLIIAHRLSTVTKADQVLVLEEGQIVESGTPGELIESGGKFARYWQLQSPLSKDTSWPANS